jgi:3-hydroxyacyl-CoA dehydrogenase
MMEEDEPRRPVRTVHAMVDESVSRVDRVVSAVPEKLSVKNDRCRAASK